MYVWGEDGKRGEQMFGRIEELENLAKEIITLAEHERFLTYLITHIPKEEFQKYVKEYRKEKGEQT